MTSAVSITQRQLAAAAAAAAEVKSVAAGADTHRKHVPSYNGERSVGPYNEAEGSMIV